MTSVKLQYDDLMNPVIQALKSLGGSGTNEEIKDLLHKCAIIGTCDTKPSNT